MEAERCLHHLSTGRRGKDNATTSTLTAEGPIRTHDEAGVDPQGTKVPAYVHRQVCCLWARQDCELHVQGGR